MGSPRLRVAFSLAAQENPAAESDTRSFLSRLLPEATVARFSVAGEADAGSMERARERVLEADLIFLGGGDPVLVAQRLVASGADDWVREAHSKGATCVGVSAGSIVLGAFWASWSDDNPNAAPEVIRCAGVAPRLVVDCHDEGSNWDELRAVRECLGDQGRELTFAGIGHRAALVVHRAGDLEWIGPQMVLP
jgi:cyanophycinase-like exopeptidase